MGFTLNPYDACVANKVMDGKQCTIVWHGDDTKILHEDDKVVSQVIQKIEARFGEMTIAGGTEHVFLGMNISFHQDGTASIKMKEYIKEAIANFGDNITRSATTPAKRNLMISMRTALLWRILNARFSIAWWQNYSMSPSEAD